MGKWFKKIKVPFREESFMVTFKWPFSFLQVYYKKYSFHIFLKGIHNLPTRYIFPNENHQASPFSVLSFLYEKLNPIIRGGIIQLCFRYQISDIMH